MTLDYAVPGLSLSESVALGRQVLGISAGRRPQWVRLYMASLMPARMSQLLTGQDVKNPAIMPACMRNQ
jgi:hypothetical protein